MLLHPISATLVILLSAGCVMALAENATFPAIIVFGDSIVDTGNNNYISTVAKCNFPPYGRDFPGRVPTGRFSNGRIESDFAAEFFGIKEIVPAYLDPTLQLQDLLTGVSFASGGAGYDPVTARTASVLSIEDQIKLFKGYKERIRASIGEEQTATLISEALFLVVCGTNDLTITYPSLSALISIDSYTNLTVGYASEFLQELYNLGARRISLFGIPAIGCIPLERTIGGGLQRACSEGENSAALLYSSKLEALASSLKKTLSGLKIVYIDVYNPLLSIIKNPEKYGFEVANKGCCGTGVVEIGPLCNVVSDAVSCRDASKFVFWDSFHPTEKGYKILTPLIFGPHVNELL